MFKKNTHTFLPRGFPQSVGIFCDLNNHEAKYAHPSVIDASTTWPTLLLCRSYSAKIIPKAQVRPPPAKSAAKLIGGVGFSLYRPNRDNSPAFKIYVIFVK